jgi:hypothetical protein
VRRKQHRLQPHRRYQHCRCSPLPLPLTQKLLTLPLTQKLLQKQQFSTHGQLLQQAKQQQRLLQQRLLQQN